MPTWDDVVRIGTSFPGMEEGTWFGTPALKLGARAASAGCAPTPTPWSCGSRTWASARRCCRASPTRSSPRPTTTATRTCSCGSTKVDPSELAELIEEAWRIKAPKRVIKAYDAEREGLDTRSDSRQNRALTCDTVGARDRCRAPPPRPPQARSALRRLGLRGDHLDRHLLPAELPGAHGQARERAPVPHRRGRPGRRLPGLQALPARRRARLAGVGHPRRHGRPRDAPDRRRRGGPRGRDGSRVAGSATPSATCTASSCAVTGAGPLALARAQRAQTARVLLETTSVSITDVAFAAGFRSVRQFNATIREIFATAPRELRSRARAQRALARDAGRSCCACPTARRSTPRA